MQDEYLNILKEYWGFDSFRGIQEQIVHSIGEGKDTLGLMPTGGGKSITFQVPALAHPGICIVVTPLIALMKDQVEHLKDKGIKAAAIYAGMTQNQIIVTLENCIFGDYKFLYISPERISSDIFQAKVKSMHLNMIAVDEAHCISQWGYDFRPSYLKIADLRKRFPDVPVLALTATATPEVVEDIQDKLQFKERNVFRMSFYRKNIAYVVRETDNKLEEMMSILNKTQGSAIVYVRSRQKTKEISDLLNANGITAEFYHAGLLNEIKDDKQRKWMSNEVRVIVATNAFGMGIDKPDVRVVLHIDAPDSIEAYFQEAGRAGRDGVKSYAIMLYTSTDKRKMLRRIQESFPEKDYIKNLYEDICFYFQIAMGSGSGDVYEFNLFDFCKKFNYRAATADSALKILTNAGYIEYTEEQETNSRLTILVDRTELENTLSDNKDEQDIMEIIMRSYTGIFSDYAFIDETLIAYKCNLRLKTVYECLINLSRRRLINYIPHKKTPYIIFTKSRTEKEYLQLYDYIYNERKEKYEKQINAMLDYCQNDVTCRSRILLKYFGEKKTSNCMQCDVCLQHTSSGIRLGELGNIEEQIVEELKEHGPIAITEVKQRFANLEGKLEPVLRYMSDMETIAMVNGCIELIQKKQDEKQE